MRYAVLVPLSIVCLFSNVSNAAAADGSVGTTSVGQAQISLTIPERLDVRVVPDTRPRAKLADRVEVDSNLGDTGLKYSVKRVVFVDRTGKKASSFFSRGANSATQRTEVVVVVPE